MALTEDDDGLVVELRRLLAQSGASWIAEEVDADLASRGANEPGDTTVEAVALIVGISRSLGALPAMLLDANEAIRGVAGQLGGVTLGDNEIPLAATDAELQRLAQAAATLAAPIAQFLEEATMDE
jgi:hypothetical protein